jgi:NADPH2:quinone reductase
MRSLLIPSMAFASRQTRKMTTVPSVMKAVFVEKTGGPEVLQFRSDYPVPTLKTGQLLVKNNLSGINYIDTYFRTGLYPSPKPEVLGTEGAGIVVALGPGNNPNNLRIGDRVIWLNTGGYAEYSAVPASKTAKIPDDISDEAALAAFLSGLTAVTLTRETYPVRKGEWVLVHAAAGGAGYLITQLLKSIGAKVIGTVGGSQKVKLVENLGADVVIDYRSQKGKDWVKIVKEVTDGQGVSVVYDSVGKDTWEGSLDVVKKKGTVVWFGNASGPVPDLPLRYVYAILVP